MTETEIRQQVAGTITGWRGAVTGSATHKEIIDLYNSHTPRPRGYKVTYKDAWCAATVSAVAIKLGLTDIMPVECGCGSMIKLYQALGRWVEDDNYLPQIGDIIMYDWGDGANYAATDNKGAPDHVGIVTKVTLLASGNCQIKVTEGNYNGVVQDRYLMRNARYIRGYCIPDYASKATPDGPWYQSWMQWGKEMGLHDGTRPNDPVTRAEISVMLHNLYDKIKA